MVQLVNYNIIESDLPPETFGSVVYAAGGATIVNSKFLPGSKPYLMSGYDFGFGDWVEVHVSSSPNGGSQATIRSLRGSQVERARKDILDILTPFQERMLCGELAA